MSDLTLSENHISTMSETAIDKVRYLEKFFLSLPQVSMATHHLIHAGMYSRTIMVPAGVALTGALIKIATILIFSGDFILFAGDEAIELNGYNVLAGGPNRKQAGVAKTDTWVTMIFPTSAKTVEEAEKEFTDEFDRLFSRHDDADNSVIVMGE
jgi:hypothetical protein